MHIVGSDDDASIGTDGDDGEMAVVADTGNGFVERLDLVERKELGLVSEEDVDLVGDQGAEVARGGDRRRTNRSG